MTNETPILAPEVLKRLIKKSKTIKDLYNAIYERGLKDGAREAENTIYVQLRNFNSPRRRST